MSKPTDHGATDSMHAGWENNIDSSIPTLDLLAVGW
jgi:hypothetical protein